MKKLKDTYTNEEHLAWIKHVSAAEKGETTFDQDWQAEQGADYANGLRAEEIAAELREDPELCAAVINLLNQDNYIDEQENREREE